MRHGSGRLSALPVASASLANGNSSGLGKADPIGTTERNKSKRKNERGRSKSTTRNNTAQIASLFALSSLWVESRESVEWPAREPAHGPTARLGRRPHCELDCHQAAICASAVLGRPAKPRQTLSPEPA